MATRRRPILCCGREMKMRVWHLGLLMVAAWVVVAMVAGIDWQLLMMPLLASE